MWSTWMHHNLSPNLDQERLQIVKLLLYLQQTLVIYRSNLDWQKGVDLMQQLREKVGLLEVPWFRAAAKIEQISAFSKIHLVLFVIDV